MADPFPFPNPQKQDDKGYWFDPRWALNYVYDPIGLAWVPETQPGGGGGGGGAVTVADGADVAEGTTTDPAWVSGAGTTIALLKTLAQSKAMRGDYDGSGNLVYFGLAATGTADAASSWQIRKFLYDGSGNLLDILWANGVNAFNQAWTGRAGLSYS